MKNKRVYIAMPYSDTDPDIVAFRMGVFARCDNVFIKQGAFTVSPLQKHFTAIDASAVPGDWDFWKGYSEAYLSISQVMVVIMLDGWMNSTGVAGELAFCRSRNIPIVYLTPGDILSENFDILELEKFASFLKNNNPTSRS